MCVGVERTAETAAVNGRLLSTLQALLLLPGGDRLPPGATGVLNGDIITSAAARPSRDRAGSLGTGPGPADRTADAEHLTNVKVPAVSVCSAAHWVQLRYKQWPLYTFVQCEHIID